jgi:hypothetical protein
LPIAISEQYVKKLSGDHFLRATAIASLIEQHGFHRARSILQAKSCRNSTRVFKQFEKNAQPQPDLQTIYATAISKQLAA